MVLGVALGGTAQCLRLRQQAPRRAASRPVPAQAERVVVEVLNTSDAVGLARLATGRLRDGGIDVVSYGSDTGNVDTTQILVRRGDPANGAKVRRVLGTGAVRMAADPSRLVDVTVRLGRDFAAFSRQP